MYALKAIDKKNFGNLEFKKCIDREVELVPVLDHCNIIRFEGQFEDNEHVYFLSEFCELGNLRSFLIELKKKRKQLSVDLVRFWIIEIINALRYLDSLVLVHRDIKPENILLDNTFHVKVCDFGATKQYSKQEAETLYTQTIDLNSSVSSATEDFNRSEVHTPCLLAMTKPIVSQGCREADINSIDIAH